MLNPKNVDSQSTRRSDESKQENNTTDLDDSISISLFGSAYEREFENTTQDTDTNISNQTSNSTKQPEWEDILLSESNSQTPSPADGKQTQQHDKTLNAKSDGAAQDTETVDQQKLPNETYTPESRRKCVNTNVTDEKESPRKLIKKQEDTEEQASIDGKHGQQTEKTLDQRSFLFLQKKDTEDYGGGKTQDTAIFEEAICQIHKSIELNQEQEQEVISCASNNSFQQEESTEPNKISLESLPSESEKELVPSQIPNFKNNIETENNGEYDQKLLGRQYSRTNGLLTSINESWELETVFSTYTVDTVSSLKQLDKQEDEKTEIPNEFKKLISTKTSKEEEQVGKENDTQKLISKSALNVHQETKNDVSIAIPQKELLDRQQDNKTPVTKDRENLQQIDASKRGEQNVRKENNNQKQISKTGIHVQQDRKNHKNIDSPQNNSLDRREDKIYVTKNSGDQQLTETAKKDEQQVRKQNDQKQTSNTIEVQQPDAKNSKSIVPTPEKSTAQLKNYPRRSILKEQQQLSINSERVPLNTTQKVPDSSSRETTRKTKPRISFAKERRTSTNPLHTVSQKDEFADRNLSVRTNTHDGVPRGITFSASRRTSLITQDRVSALEGESNTDKKQSMTLHKDNIIKRRSSTSQRPQEVSDTSKWQSMTVHCRQSKDNFIRMHSSTSQRLKDESDTGNRQYPKRESMDAYKKDRKDYDTGHLKKRVTIVLDEEREKKIKDTFGTLNPSVLDKVFDTSSSSHPSSRSQSAQSTIVIHNSFGSRSSGFVHPGKSMGPSDFDLVKKKLQQYVKDERRDSSAQKRGSDNIQSSQMLIVAPKFKSRDSAVIQDNVIQGSVIKDQGKRKRSLSLIAFKRKRVSNVTNPELLNKSEEQSIPSEEDDREKYGSVPISNARSNIEENATTSDPNVNTQTQHSIKERE